VQLCRLVSLVAALIRHFRLRWRLFRRLRGSRNVIPLRFSLVLRFNLKELLDRVAIVTGSGSGIGAAIVKGFAGEGALITAADIDRKRANRIVEQVGRRAIAIQTDVTKLDSVSRMVGQTLETFGRIDILVSNAGIGWLSGSLNDPSHRIIENLTESEWDKVMTVNLRGFFFCAKSVAPTMKKQRSGVIISIASTAAFVGSDGTRGSGFHYNVSKSGIVSLNKTLALQLGKYGIRVNCISPGVIADPDSDGIQTIGMRLTRGERERLRATIPVRRLGRPKDVANAAVFLASDKAAYIHGTVIDVNGGEFIRH
jgi:3-oxoacyl-[acyl-carrier protein] reductase